MIFMKSRPGDLSLLWPHGFASREGVGRPCKECSKYRARFKSFSASSGRLMFPARRLVASNLSFIDALKITCGNESVQKRSASLQGYLTITSVKAESSTFLNGLELKSDERIAAG